MEIAVKRQLNMSEHYGRMVEHMDVCQNSIDVCQNTMDVCQNIMDVCQNIVDCRDPRGAICQVLHAPSHAGFPILAERLILAEPLILAERLDDSSYASKESGGLRPIEHPVVDR